MLKQNGNSTKAKIKKILLIFCITLLAFPLFADNNMELIWEQQGEFIESEYGYSLASIDYNGDGIDDLVVGSPEWNSNGLPGGTNQGKIYFYFGNTVFDTIPDLTIDGAQHNFLSRLGDHIVNLHDINGDGYEDLGSIWKDDWQSDIKYFVDIYFGGPDSDTIPDFTHIIYREGVENITSFYPLGDVNGDGFYDAGYVLRSPTPTFDNRFYILYGAEIPTIEDWAGFGSIIGTIREIGNINNDAFDDFLVTFKDSETELKHNVIFYGNTIVGTNIIDTLYSQTTTTYDSGGSLVGDFNGDGTDDFIGCWGFYDIGTFLWFGEDEQNSEPSIILDCITNGNKCLGWGDLNNDGFSDIVLGRPGWSNDQGKAYFFIGDENANGSIDLDIPAPIIVGSKFGSTVAVGDFNDDGFDDAAIGAPSPYSSWYPGYVYVYAGNDSLEETTPVSVNEIITIPEITFNAYPNPFNPTVNFEIKAEGYDNLQIEIYNIKGQKVETISPSLCHPEPGEGQGETITWNAENQPSGVYLCKLVNIINQKQLAVHKITLLK